MSRLKTSWIVMANIALMSAILVFVALYSNYDICWDPRNRPEYVEIGHNAIRTAYKGNGFGKAQLAEALRRIREYEGLKEIRVRTNSNLIAPRELRERGICHV